MAMNNVVSYKYRREAGNEENARTNEVMLQFLCPLKRRIMLCSRPKRHLMKPKPSLL